MKHEIWADFQATSMVVCNHYYTGVTGVTPLAFFIFN